MHLPSAHPRKDHRHSGHIANLLCSHLGAGCLILDSQKTYSLIRLICDSVLVRRADPSHLLAKHSLAEPKLILLFFSELHQETLLTLSSIFHITYMHLSPWRLALSLRKYFMPACLRWGVLVPAGTCWVILDHTMILMNKAESLRSILQWPKMLAALIF